MIIPMTLDGKPFEGMALVLLAMQIISFRIELRGTEGEGLIGSFFTFLLASIPYVLLGTQKIAELKTYLLVLGVFGAISFLGSIVMRYTAMAFRAAVGLGLSIAAYFLIDTRYDTAVWALFASNLFYLMYALFVVGPAKRLMVNPALVKKFRDTIEFTPGKTMFEKRIYIAKTLKTAAGMSKEDGERYLRRLIKVVDDEMEAANRDYDESMKRERGVKILRSVINGPRR